MLYRMEQGKIAKRSTSVIVVNGEIFPRAKVILLPINKEVNFMSKSSMGKN